MSRSSAGFSLIEVLIAITILAGVSVLLSQSFFSLTRVNTKVEVVKDMKQSGDFAIGTIEQMVRQNKGIVSDCTETGVESNSLRFINPDGNITTLHCLEYTIGSVTVNRLASSSASNDYFLTSTNASLGNAPCTSGSMNLKFTCTTFPSQPAVVNVSFSLKQAGVAADTYEQGNVEFETTINTRN